MQPFPRLSEAVGTHPDWTIGQWYEDAVGMHVFLEKLKDRHLARVATETGVRLLGYPEPEAPGLFSPAALMNPADGLHQAEAYGDFVLDRLVEACTGRPALARQVTG